VGYAKQMMELARDWLRLNPDPRSPFLKVPGFDKNKNRARAHGVSAEKLRQLEIQTKLTPALAPILEQLKDLDRQVRAESVQLHDHAAEFEDNVRSRKPGQEKYALDDRHPTAGQWILSWARSGYNAFDLSADFVAAMLLTDARALDVDLVRLPFPSVLIMIPDGFAIGVEGRSYTKIHVTEVAAPDVKLLHVRDVVWDMLKDLPYDEAQKFLAQAQREVDVVRPASLLDRTGGSLLGQSPVVRPSAELGSLHIYATDGAHVLDTWIDRKDLTWDAFDDLPDLVEDGADKRARQTLRQVVFGMLAYVSAVDGAVEARFPEPRKSPREDRSRVAQWVVGRTVRIDPTLVRLARSGDREAQFRLKYRFIVRGHYRNQAHGPQRSLRTSKWIACFWKGPADGAELVHTYKLDDPGKA
jgi:hypothetical protein